MHLIEITALKRGSVFKLYGEEHYLDLWLDEDVFRARPAHLTSDGYVPFGDEKTLTIDDLLEGNATLIQA